MDKTWTWSTTGYSFVGRDEDETRQTCRHAGLSGVEACNELLAGLDGDALVGLRQRYETDGLRFDTYHLPFSATEDIASFYETARQKAVASVSRALERAGALGVRAAIQHGTTCRFPAVADGVDRYLEQLGRSLESLLPVAAEHGIVLAVENLPPGENGGRFTSQPEHFEAMRQRFDDEHLGFCLDTGHALISGAEVSAEIVDAMGERLAAFHLSDTAGDRDSHLAPGHGLVDFAAVFRRAAELGYAGSMCIETPPFAAGPDYALAAWKQMVDDTEVIATGALG